MNIVLSLLLLSIFFPAVSFGLFPGEISAFPLLLSVPYLAITLRVNGSYLACIFTALCFLVLLTYIFGILQNCLIPLPVLVKTFSSYLQLGTVSLVFASISFSDDIIRAFLRVSRFSATLHLLVGFMQLIGVGSILTPVFSIMISRYYPSSLSEGARGVAFLTNEPSHSIIAVILPIIFLFIWGSKSDRRLASLALFLTIVASRSLSSYIFFIIALFAYLTTEFCQATRILSVTKNSLIAALVFVVPTILLCNTAISNPRVRSLLSDGSQSLVDTIIMASGFRAVNIIASFHYLMNYSAPACIGFGSWFNNMNRFILDSGYQLSELGHFVFNPVLISEIRPGGLALNLIVDFWWFGVLVIILFIVYGTRVNLFFRIMGTESLVAALVSAVFFMGLLVWNFGFPTLSVVFATFTNRSFLMHLNSRSLYHV